MTTTTIALGVIGVVLSLPAWAMFARGAWHLFRFVRQGQPLPRGSRTNEPLRRLWRVVVETFGHTHFRGRPLVNIAHWLVMVGFLFGAVVWFEAYIQAFNPADGWPWVSQTWVYHLAEEILSVGTVLGIGYLIAVRLGSHPGRRASRFFNSNQRAAHAIEAIVLIEGLGMLLVKAGKIATYGEARWTDPASAGIAKLLPASPVMVSVFALIKLLTGMVFLVLVGRNLGWGIAWHRFAAPFNIFFQRNPSGRKALGELKPMTAGDKEVDVDNVEEEDTLGVGQLADASWKMLLDSSVCTECGRCQDLCPAWNTQKPLSPKKLMLDIKHGAVQATDESALRADDSHAAVDVLAMARSMSDVITDDVLWSCTNCGACVDQCPVDIEHIDHITDLRRFRVLADSEFPSELTGMFKNIETKGNPWGRNSKERRTWIDEARADGIEVPVIGEDDTDFSDLEYLLWVGCAGAYDDAGRVTTRATVDLLHTAGVKFGVLATGETCTGDPARRAGNEFLFQMMAQQNVSTLNAAFEGVPAGQRKIITTCPHCFNTLRNEYPDFDGHFDVFHHTQLLNRLVRDGLLTPIPRTAENRKPITYHDPCFLGRHNRVYDPPRELLEATGAQLKEMDKNREEAFCCGAGGARMFMEEKLGRRINEFRTEQALDTGVEEIATGCPYCNVMLTGGVKTLEDKPTTQVSDVAVMLRNSIAPDGALPAPRKKAFLGTPKRLPITSAKKNQRTEGSEGGATDAGDGAPARRGVASEKAATQAPGQASKQVPAAEQKPAAAPTPAAPKAPSAPASPAAPKAPGAPAAPAALSAPKAPTASKVPAAPGAPTAPASLVTPKALSAPATPAEPDVPSAPKAPAAPKAPNVPKAPAAGTSHAPTPPASGQDKHGVPTPPSAPTPSAPKSPQAPSVPTAPATPNTQEVPSTPGASKAPEPPKAPSTPKGTARPSVPKPPAAPSTSSVPDAPAPPAKQDGAKDAVPRPPQPPRPPKPAQRTGKGTPPAPPAPPAPPEDD